MTLHKGFYKHNEHGAVVELLNTASSKGAPTVAVYRPLSREAHVYKNGRMWDYRPAEEFDARYTLIIDKEELARHRKTADEMYA